MNFADYRELSWWYAIDLIGVSEFGLESVYMLGARDGKPLIVAQSFSEFLRLYVHDDSRMWQEGAFAYTALRRNKQYTDD